MSVSYVDLGKHASAAVQRALDACVPKMEADAEPLEAWLYAIALRLYEVLSDLTVDDPEFDQLWDGLWSGARETHLARFGSFEGYENDDDTFAGYILELFDATGGVADAIGRGASAVHTAIREADVLPSGWGGNDRALATLGTMLVLERAFKDVPES